MASNEYAVRCGNAAAGLPPSALVVRLRLHRPERNVRLRIEDVCEGLWSEVPAVLADLMEVAAYVYTADQACSRGPDTDPGLGTRWRRRLHFAVPVRLPGLWSRPDVNAALVEALSFVSEDEYHFCFEPFTDRPPRAERYIRFGTDRFGGTVEEVALFSGGLDALAGAAEAALLHRRQVLLVNHRPSPRREPGVARLARLLAAKPGAVPPIYLPVRVNKSKSLTGITPRGHGRSCSPRWPRRSPAWSAWTG